MHYIETVGILGMPLLADISVPLLFSQPTISIIQHFHRVLFILFVLPVAGVLFRVSFLVVHCMHGALHSTPPCVCLSLRRYSDYRPGVTTSKQILTL
jgi:hypothetical protein